MKIATALTFDDVFIQPNYSDIESRKHVSTRAQLTSNFTVEVPLISAPMDSVSSDKMVLALSSMRERATGALHRFCSVEENVVMVKAVKKYADVYPTFECFGGPVDPIPVIASVGAVGDEERIEKVLEAGANILLVDVAHGDHIHVKNIMKFINNIDMTFDVILGNIATADAAMRLEDWGADALRVGIGGGSMCTTRIRTGVGIPQITALDEVCKVASVPVISDGGIRSSGDVAKALAAGADTVMIGSLLSGTDEAPGDMFVTGDWPKEKKFKVYRGSASMAIKAATTGKTENVEGTATLVPVKGGAQSVVTTIMEGVRSSMSYVGAKNLTEFKQKAKFVRVTNAGLTEAHPHGLQT